MQGLYLKRNNHTTTIIGNELILYIDNLYTCSYILQEATKSFENI